VSITREALCRSEFCPEPRNPDFHECVACGAPAVEHAHIVARSRAPSRRKDKNNVVALCHAHHELQTLNKWAFHEQALPFDGLVHQWLTDERGVTVWKRDVRVSSATDEGLGATEGRLTSSVAPGASTAEGEAPTGNLSGVATASLSAADAASGAGEGPAMTSGGRPLGGDGAPFAPPDSQGLPSPPISVDIGGVQVTIKVEWLGQTDERC